MGLEHDESSPDGIFSGRYDPKIFSLPSIDSAGGLEEFPRDELFVSDCLGEDDDIRVLIETHADTIETLPRARFVYTKESNDPSS